MLQEANKFYPLETGGVLGGYKTKDQVGVITNLFRSGPSAEHNLKSYIPDYVWDEKKIARLYTESRGQSTYMGDWHTHPKTGAYLSKRDELTLGTIAISPQARLASPYMIILATQPFELKAWQWVRSNPKEMEIFLF